MAIQPPFYSGDIPTIRVRMLVSTFSMAYGQLTAGQEYDVDPYTGRSWVQDGLAEEIPGVTPISAPILTSGAWVNLIGVGIVDSAATTEFSQTDPYLQGLAIYMGVSNRLTVRMKGFYTVTFYLLVDQRVDGRASIWLRGAEYRSMPLVESAGNRGQATAAAVTVIAVGPLDEGDDVGAVFVNTDVQTTNFVEGSLTMMGG